MTGYEFFLNYWWIFPLVMFVFCIFFMRKGCSRMMSGCCSDGMNSFCKGDDKSFHNTRNSKIAQDDLDKNNNALSEE